MNLVELLPALGAGSLLTILLNYLINKKKIDAEGNIKSADYIQKLFELGKKQLDDVNVEVNRMKDSNHELMKQNSELMKQNTIILDKNKVLLEENIELRKKISNLGSKVSDLEKKELHMVAENKILKREIDNLASIIRKYESTDK